MVIIIFLKEVINIETRNDLQKKFIEILDNGISLFKVENNAHIWFYTAERNGKEIYSAETDINAFSGATYENFKKFCQDTK